MEATLRLFLHPERLRDTHPTYAALTAALVALRARAEALLPRVQKAAPGWTVEVAPSSDAVGAGSLPTVELPGFAIRVVSTDVEAGELAKRLRSGTTPVFTTVSDGGVHFHVRTLLAGDDEALLAAIGAVASATLP